MSNEIQLRSLRQMPRVQPLAVLQCGQRYERQPPSRLDFHCDEHEPVLQQHYTRRVSQMADVVLYDISDALVFGKGLIVIGDGLVQENTEGAPTAKVLAQLNQAIPVAERVIEEPILYTTRYGVLNYGHCLTDIVPRIVWALRANPDLKAAIHPEFVPMAKLALWAMGIDHARLVTLDERPTLLKQGRFVSPCSSHPLGHLPASIQLLRDELLPLAEFAQEIDFPTHVHVSRADARTRHYYNDSEVTKALKAHGFDSITTGKLTLMEQVALFSRAKSIVGIAGASMTNILFAPVGVPVRLMAPCSMPALYYWDLASQCQLDFGIAYFDTDEPAQGIHASFRAPLPQVRALLGVS